MNIYKTLSGLSGFERGAVVAIGNFDGVHRGHQALLAHARQIADGMGKKLAVLTFEPHPRRLLRPDDPPFRITPSSVRTRRLAACGVDLLFQLKFDWDFASQSAETFIANVLGEKGAAAAHIVVGFDFRFGQLRKGSPETLRQAGFAVTVMDEISDEQGGKFSSTSIRTALRYGKIGEANAMLGWDWEIEGAVSPGDRRGRELGFPTANVPLGQTLHPAYGVYATLVKIAEDGEDSPWLPSATNIGIRPMFEVETAQVEAYIFDFNRDIYGKTLRVRPVRRLRGEARFDTLEALIAQIEQDCRDAREVLQKT